MPNCASCGEPVSGRYCTKCGAAVDNKEAMDNKETLVTETPPVSAGLPMGTAAGATYLLGIVTGVLFLVLEPYNKNRLVRFHAFQSIFLNLAVFLAWWLLSSLLPFLFWHLTSLLELLFYVPFVYMLIETLRGRKILLPFIGDLAEKQAGGTAH